MTAAPETQPAPAPAGRTIVIYDPSTDETETVEIPAETAKTS